MIKTKNSILILSILSLILINPICSAEKIENLSSSDVIKIIGLMMYFIIIIVSIMIFGGIWIYRDAQKRGSNPELWLIIFLLSAIIGYFIWLIVRPKLIKSNLDKLNKITN